MIRHCKILFQLILKKALHNTNTKVNVKKMYILEEIFVKMCIKAVKSYLSKYSAGIRR